MAVAEFGTRPTRMVRHVPIGRVGLYVGLIARKTRKEHPHSALFETATPAPVHFDWGRVFRAVPRERAELDSTWTLEAVGAVFWSRCASRGALHA